MTPAKKIVVFLLARKMLGKIDGKTKEVSIISVQGYALFLTVGFLSPFYIGIHCKCGLTKISILQN